MDRAEIAANKSEEIAGFREGIAPNGKVALRSGDGAGIDFVAVAEKNRRFRNIGFDTHLVYAEYIRPIEEIGDAAKTFRLALCAIGRTRAVEPHQPGVGGGIGLGDDFKLERLLRR